MPNGDPRWQQLDGQDARIERATVANNTQQLFAVYAPDFEAHMFNGEVWSFKRHQDLRSHRRRRMTGRQSPWNAARRFNARAKGMQDRSRSARYRADSCARE